MRKKDDLSLIPKESIISKIYYIRGKKVMFDRDLAELYGVEARVLNQAVKRNKDRFPEDFMFQLNKVEFEQWKDYISPGPVIMGNNLKSQIVISSWGGIRKYPLVFTEQGVAMLSSVLNSKRAIQVNIQIIRTFTKLRELLLTHKELSAKIEQMEKSYNKKFGQQDKQIKLIFETIKLLLKEDEEPKREIGFKMK